MDWRHIILPTKPGKINFTSFCVEHGRWTRRGGEPLAIFASATETIAAKELKLAVRVDGDQTEVWNKAAKAQDRLSGVAGAEVRSAASPSSFAMTMVAPVVKSIDGYLRQLAGVIDGRSDVIGYAFAINGKVNSAAVYASHDLFARLWPKLLRSSAVEVVSKYDNRMKFTTAGVAAVRAARRLGAS